MAEQTELFEAEDTFAPTEGDKEALKEWMEFFQSDRPTPQERLIFLLEGLGVHSEGFWDDHGKPWESDGITDIQLEGPKFVLEVAGPLLTWIEEHFDEQLDK